MRSLAHPDGGLVEPGDDLDLPVLHLDGEALRNSLRAFVESADKFCGVETLIDSLNAKSRLFSRTFTSVEHLSQPEFLDACAFIPTVRRRLKTALQKDGFERLRSLLDALLADLTIDNVDGRIKRLTDAFPDSKEYRWTRDLAAEIIHYRDPDTFPLMTRWIWDRGSNTGVLREFWFQEYRDARLDVSDGIKMHVSLREELSEFLKQAGVYANLPFMIDLHCAWAYSEYIGSQGGSFLKTDFSQSSSPLGYALRMLGLDGDSFKDGRSRLVLPDGKRHVLSNIVDATTH